MDKKITTLKKKIRKKIGKKNSQTEKKNISYLVQSDCHHPFETIVDLLITMIEIK